MINLTQQEQQFFDQAYEKLSAKIQAQLGRLGDKIPYIAHDGVYEDYGVKNIYWWTNSFWTGMLWLMYHAEKKDAYKNAARRLEERLDEALRGFTRLHHDVGFLWMHSAAADYRLTGFEKSRDRAWHAACSLAGRFDPVGRYILAWNSNPGYDRRGWMIVDTMMNLQLLFWASKEFDETRFAHIAMAHADTALQYILRPDGSCNHAVVFDPQTGEYKDNPGCQGYEPGSSWSRGQTWMIYGMALCYRHTKKQEYLDAAKKTAHYFISNVCCRDYIAPADFRAPNQALADTTATACAACGLLEIAEHVGELEKDMYISNAKKMIESLCRTQCDWNVKKDGILQNGTNAYFGPEFEVPIIYGDYFLTEALLRLLEKGYPMWG